MALDSTTPPPPQKKKKEFLTPHDHPYQNVHPLESLEPYKEEDDRVNPRYSSRQVILEQMNFEE